MPNVKDLHWLPVNYRVQFKVLLHVYRAVNNMSPSYLTEILEHYHPPRALRSSTLCANVSILELFQGKA